MMMMHDVMITHDGGNGGGYVDADNNDGIDA